MLPTIYPAALQTLFQNHEFDGFGSHGGRDPAPMHRPGAHGRLGGYYGRAGFFPPIGAAGSALQAAVARARQSLAGDKYHAEFSLLPAMGAELAGHFRLILSASDRGYAKTHLRCVLHAKMPKTTDAKDRD